MNKWMKVSAGGVIILIAGMVALFFLVNANTFRPLLEAQLTSALGRQVKVGTMRFAPFSGSLVADNFSIADDPRYGAQPFLIAKQVRIGVEMAPLVFSRQLHVRSLEIDQPKIRLAQGPQDVWNFSSLGQTKSPNAQSSPTASGFSIHRLTIRDGQATVEDFPVAGGSHTYGPVNVTAQDISLAGRIPFSLSMGLPGNGTSSITGTAGPIDTRNAAMTPVDAQISIRHLDPVAAGILDPALGISTLANVDAHAASSHGILHSRGTIHLGQLRLKKNGIPSPVPIDIGYDATQTLADRSGQIANAEIHIGHGTVHLNGKYRTVSNQPTFNVDLSGQNLPIDDLQSLIKSAAIRLPNGSALQGGTLNFQLNATGTPGSSVVTGPVALANTRLAGFDLSSKISGIAALGGIKTGDITDIRSLRMNLRATDRGLNVDNIDFVMPALGEATGSGTVSPAGVLNFRLTVKVTAVSGMQKAGVGLLAKLNATGNALGVAKGVPIQVRGTANDPVITADVNSLMRKNNPKALINRLFGKKL